MKWIGLRRCTNGDNIQNTCGECTHGVVARPVHSVIYVCETRNRRLHAVPTSTTKHRGASFESKRRSTRNNEVDATDLGCVYAHYSWQHRLGSGIFISYHIHSYNALARIALAYCVRPRTERRKLRCLLTCSVLNSVYFSFMSTMAACIFSASIIDGILIRVHSDQASLCLLSRYHR